MMKKIRMFWIAAVALAALVCAMVVLTACSSAASLTATYVNGSVKSNGYGGQDSSVAQLNLYDDGTYDMVTTTLQYGYGMNLETTSITLYGTYTEGATTDGYTEYTLSDATRVVLNSYSTAGGFNIYIDTVLTTEYPAELPAQSEGEKTFAQNAQDVLDKYGKSIKVYVGDKNVFELTNPAG